MMNSLSTRWAVCSRMYFIFPFIFVMIISTSTTMSELLVYNAEQCEDQCLRVKGCTTFQIHKIEGKNNFNCVLLNLPVKSLEIRSKLLAACANNTCKHGGTCVEDVTSCRRFRCLCKKNWQGETCETRNF